MNMEKKFSKKCPNCENIQSYTTKNRFERSIIEGWVCNGCSQQLRKKVYDDEIVKQVILEYNNGVSYSKIAMLVKINRDNVKNILIENGVWVDGRDNIKKEFNDDDINDIINKYINEGLSCLAIAKYYNISKRPINRVLKEKGLLREGSSDGVKINLTDEQKDIIKKLYIEEFKTTCEISKELGLTKPFIDKYLCNCGYRRNRSEGNLIGSEKRKGRKVSEETRIRMSSAQKKYAMSGNRVQTGGVCRKFLIENISCQGTYEKYYIEKLIKEGKKIPNNSKPINTPYGTYYPDFSFDDRLIEVKSDYTYDVLIGKKQSRFTKKTDTTQYEKIKWVDKNVIPVEILIVDKKNNKLIKKEIF